MVRGECCICSSLLASPDPGRCGRVIKASKISLILQLWPTVALQMGESYSSSKCPWKLWSPYKITTFLHYWNSQSTLSQSILSKMQDIVSFWTGAVFRQHKENMFFFSCFRYFSFSGSFSYKTSVKVLMRDVKANKAKVFLFGKEKRKKKKKPLCFSSESRGCHTALQTVQPLTSNNC